MDKLQCIIGGHERGGTTLFIEILKNHPLINGGFECGMLMWKSPIEFINSGIHWEIFKTTWCGNNSINAVKVCTTESFSEACDLIHQFKGYDDNVKLFYKSPAYMLHLNAVLSRCSRPCIIISRDPRGLFWSRCKHNDILPGDAGIDQFCDRYNDYASSLEQALEIHKDRILIIQYEKFCQNPIRWGKTLFNFIGLDFEDAYIDSFDNKRASYSVHGEKIDPSYCYEWKEHLNSHQVNRKRLKICLSV
jgi:hypothetical protein